MSSTVIEQRRGPAAGRGMPPRSAGAGVRRVPTAPHRGVDRSGAWRRPAGAPARLPLHGASVGRGPHPVGAAGRRRAGTGAVLVVAVLLGFIMFAAVQVRSMGAATVPRSVGTVEVASGDTLSAIARRAAPGAPVDQMIDRIIALNGMDGAAVRPGQSLLVPTGEGR